jgi:hypothetical protein
MARARTWEAELADLDALIEPDGRRLRLLLEDAREIARAKARHEWDEASAQASAAAASVPELEEIAQALEQAHNAYLLAVDPSDGELTPRAHFVVDEIASALEFLFVHQTRNLGNPRLARLAEMHKADPDTPFALAVKLMDYVELAGPQRAALEKLGGFDASLIDEASDLAIELRQRGPAGERSAEARAARHRCNQLATLLQRKVAAVRNAARFVFRNRPEVLREFSPPGRWDSVR